jgi:hypothetical protein
MNNFTKGKQAEGKHAEGKHARAAPTRHYIDGFI